MNRADLFGNPSSTSGRPFFRSALPPEPANAQSISGTCHLHRAKKILGQPSTAGCQTGLFDSHAHYEDKRFNKDRDDILSSLNDKGVRFVVNAASDLETAKAGVAISERYDFIYASAGIHPHEAKDAPDDFIDKIAALTQHEKVVAIGEAGLDYHYDFSPRDIQKRVFEEQLKLALALDLPVIVHDREAHADTLELLTRYKPRGIMHCYSGSAEMAGQILKLGLYIGFTGVVTFKNARKTAEAAAAVPLDRLLIETDCPYMAPEPFRGKRCDSSMLTETAAALARIKGIDIRELIDITFKNACDVYRI